MKQRLGHPAARAVAPEKRRDPCCQCGPSLATCGGGFTIMEVIAALLVIAVGIIGIAALYSDVVQTKAETQLQAQAAALAEEIATRIRANAAGRVGYAGTVGVVCNTQAAPKSPQDAAANEAACWEDRVEQSLPSGLGTVTRDISSTPVRYVIAVSWSEPQGGAASYVVQVTPGEKGR